MLSQVRYELFWRSMSGFKMCPRTEISERGLSFNIDSLNPAYTINMSIVILYLEFNWLMYGGL